MPIPATGMANIDDPAATALATLRTSTEKVTYAALSESSQVPLSTLWHRNHGRQSRKQAATHKQYLTPCEERALVDYLLRAAERGFPIPLKLLPFLAHVIARQRSSPSSIMAADVELEPPRKNWVRGFRARHPEIAAKKLRPMDWARNNIYEKVAHWFTVIERELHDPAILPENVYNMDETGIMLGVLNSQKFFVERNEPRKYRKTGVNRTLVTAVECISADGRSLSPLIIWPSSTHRSAWTTHPTPGWHFACSPSGYTNRDTVLDWYRRVFDPQTKARANGRPRILINDGFGPHESLEVLQFCHENNIILCRLPSHTSHKTQPCDVSVFGPLKTAYRELVEKLFRGGANTVGKQHFTLLYSQARRTAFTARNIKSGWAKAGLYPFNPDRVLRDIEKPPKVVANNRAPDTVPGDEPPKTPVTAENLASLRQMMEQKICGLDDESQYCFRKFADAAQIFVTARDLLSQENQNLIRQNDEKKTRASSSTIVGRGQIMSYENILEVQKTRQEQEIGGLKRKNLGSVSRRSNKRSRVGEAEEAEREIQASGMEAFCSVFEC